MAEYLRESPSTMSDKIRRFMFDNISNRNRANYYANKATGLLDLTGATLGEDAGRMVGEGAANESLLGVGKGLGLLGLGLAPIPGKKAIKSVASKLGYNPSKLAKQYPDQLPGVLTVDKKTGKEYLAKQNSPEAKAVEKARKEAQKDIDAGNYNPYFPVEERYYADPTKYNLESKTIAEAMPAKQATIDKYIKEFDTQEARKKLSEAFDAGSIDPLAKNWYAMGQLEKEFINEYGEEKGRKLFKETFADAMAATTGGADPTSNLLMANFGNYMKEAGKDLPKNAYDLPYPIGGRFASGNLSMYDKVINQGKGLSAKEQPKRYNFSSNFLGDRMAPTIDEQMSSGFKSGLKVPPGNSYGIFEKVINDLAKEKNVMPVNFQDVAWKGLKGVPGKPMIQHVNEAIERTSRLTNKKPQDVVRDSLVKRTSPLYGTGIGFGLLDEENEYYK